MAEPSTSQPGRCVLILGMHRSGTSALAGSFREFGLYMGDLLDKSFALNPKGLQEPASLVYMHENLLEANGGTWHEPPSEVVWKPLHTSVRDLFIESRHGRETWGFKEPRTLLIIDGWIEALPVWTGVGIFRDPGEVALSLKSRNGFDLDKGFHIWREYNERLLAMHRRHGVPIIEFTSDADRMREGIRRLAQHAGLTPLHHTTFFDESIPKNIGKAEALDLPSGVRQTFGALREAAL